MELVHLDADPVQPDKRLRRDSTDSTVSLDESECEPDETEVTADVRPTDQVQDLDDRDEEPVPAPVLPGLQGPGGTTSTGSWR